MDFLTYQFDEHRSDRGSNYICQLVRNRKLSGVYHRHEFYEIICVMQGRVEKCINEREQRMDAGSMVILRPADRHCFLNQSEDSLIAALSVKKEEFARIAGAYDSALIDEINKKADAVIIQNNCFAQCVQNIGLKNWSVRHREQDNRFLLMCFLKAYMESADETFRMPELLKYAVQEMKKTENLKRGIPAFLELSHYSQSQLSRLIRYYFHRSLKQYINDLRLQSAYDDILLTDCPMQDISEGLGFASFSHFQKIFKAKFSITPAALRKKNNP